MQLYSGGVYSAVLKANGTAAMPPAHCIIATALLRDWGTGTSRGVLHAGAPQPELDGRMWPTVEAGALVVHEYGYSMLSGGQAAVLTL